jgi:hypothetical protein
VSYPFTVTGVALAVSLLACSSAPLTSPMDGGREWRETRSRHIVLYTDADLETARDVVTDLEQAHAVLQKVAFPYVAKLESETQVVLLEGTSDLSVLGHETLAGAALSGFTGIEVEPVLVLSDRRSNARRETAQHELVHRFVRFYFPAAPVWLNEGLAEYYSTLRYVEGQAVIGEYLSDVTFGQSGIAMGTRDRLVLPISSTPTPATLRALAPSDFYGPEGSEQALLSSSVNYATSWALVHTLLRLPDGRARFDSYLDALHRGDASEPDAWAGSYGAVDEGRLGSLLEEFMAGHATEVVSVPISLPPIDVEDRAVSPSDVHLLWSRIRNPTAPGNEQRIRADVERALAADGSNPEAHYRRALLEHAQGNDQEALRHAARALELAPERGRYLLGLSWLETRISRGKPPAPGQRTRDRARLARLARVARTASELNYLSARALGAGERAPAWSYAKRALAADASCFYCFATAAEIAASEHDHVRAGKMMRAAVNLTPHGLEIDRLARRLAELEKLARQPRPEAAQ